MTRFGWAVLLILVLGGVGIGTAAYLYHNRTPTSSTSTTSAATSSPQAPRDLSGLSLYTSGEFGFSFAYPAQAQVEDAYTRASTSQPVPWRVHAQGAGVPIVRVSVPGSEVRIGVSTSTPELASCARTALSESEEAPLVNASTTWRRFDSEKIGTDDEWRVQSYRTILDSRCYAVELFSPLSAAASPASNESATSSLSEIITSFTFAS
jgi:hypothetical protein